MNLQLFGFPHVFFQLLALLFLDHFDLIDLILQACLLFNQLNRPFALHLKVFLQIQIFLALVCLVFGRLTAILFYHCFVFLAHHVWQSLEPL